jgi:hypothetical protein
MVLQRRENGHRQDGRYHDDRDEPQPASNSPVPAVVEISTFRNWKTGHIQKSKNALIRFPG